MSKVIVKPLKGTGLLNTNGDWLSHMRPSVTILSALLQQRIGSKEFRVVASELRDEATDAEFLKTLKESDGNERLAIESFESQFSEDAMKSETEEAKTARLAKEKADKEAQDKLDQQIKDKEKADAKKVADDKAAAAAKPQAVKDATAKLDADAAQKNKEQNTSLAPTDSATTVAANTPAAAPAASK